MSGVDAAAGLVELARRRLPAADLRVGPIEELPWPDQSFDLVTGFNAFQFAADGPAGEVEVPYEFPDLATLERALLAIAAVP